MLRAFLWRITWARELLWYKLTFSGTGDSISKTFRHTCSGWPRAPFRAWRAAGTTAPTGTRSWRAPCSGGAGRTRISPDHFQQLGFAACSLAAPPCCLFWVGVSQNLSCRANLPAAPWSGSLASRAPPTPWWRWWAAACRCVHTCPAARQLNQLALWQHTACGFYRLLVGRRLQVCQLHQGSPTVSRTACTVRGVA